MVVYASLLKALSEAYLVLLLSVKTNYLSCMVISGNDAFMRHFLVEGVAVGEPSHCLGVVSDKGNT